MRTGAAISGGLHAVLVLLAVFGAPFLSSPPAAPLNVTQVEFVDGAAFEARMSTAPVVPNEGPAEMSPPQEKPAPELAVDAPDAELARAESPAMSRETAPPQPAPQRPEVVIPPPPLEVPTEAPRPSIAEIPNPDALDRQAAEPESPEATEVMQALAEAPVPEAAPKPSPPPEPEPVVEDEPEPEPEEAETEPAPEAIAEAQPNAPISHAPQQARLPVARPAEIAAAAQASSAPQPSAPVPDPEPEETAEEPAPGPPAPEVAETPEEPEPQPPQPAAGSTSQFAATVTRGEKDALRLGIKQHFNYVGRADPGLQVTIAIGLNEQGQIVEGPEQIRASGGDQASQAALFRAGRIALIYAQNAGEFAKLPREKYDAWKSIHVTFTPDEIGFST